MKLNENDQKEIIEWINKKCGQMRCTCCGLGNWSVLDMSTLSLGYDLHSTRFHYHDGIPKITLMCTNCGHMLSFNPNIIGFKPDLPAQSNPGEEKK